MSIRDQIKVGKWVFDGSMGSLIMERKIGQGGELSLLNMTHPEDITQIHGDYAKAGVDVITANTFGANPFKLADSPYTVEEVIGQGVKLARRSGKLVALDIGPLGQLMKPMGDLTFDQAYQAFSQMVEAGEKAGADLVLIETMSDILEAKAAVLAVKEKSDLPVICTMTFQADGRTLSGNPPEVAVRVLEGLGVEGLGINCSLGPAGLLDIVKDMVALSSLPVLVQPNAGLPQYIEGESRYLLGPEDFTQDLSILVEAGASMVGGCCGTRPSHMVEVVDRLKGRLQAPTPKPSRASVCSAVQEVTFGQGPVIIGERINPTGKKRLRESLQAGSIDLCIQEAWKQRSAGAQVIDVNVSARGTDERTLYEAFIQETNGSLDTPLQIDNTKPEILERALRLYAGVPVINSVNAKQAALDAILPIVSKYGAMVIGLAMDESGLPETADDRVRLAGKIVSEAATHGIAPNRILVDCLTLAAASNRDGMDKAFAAMKRVKKDLGVFTTLGASNVSYGLPSRNILNGVYLAMAFANGLDAPITDPTVDQLRRVIDSYRFLIDAEVPGQGYVDRYGKESEGEALEQSGQVTLKQAVIEGLKADAGRLTAALLETDAPDSIIDGHLIPALNEVGDRYEKGQIYLPQLLGAAEAVRAAFDHIRSAYGSSGAVKVKGTIVLATVEGDVHDIGKNIVRVLLENYGYEIIDLGKNVKPAAVLEAVQNHQVALVGLSALMTTTVPAMEATIDLLRTAGCQVEVMVGGAVLTQDFAEEIGADFYGKDARKAVQIADRVFSKTAASKTGLLS